jgi:4-hydroxybenzoate polyprenyltransferase
MTSPGGAATSVPPSLQAWLQLLRLPSVFTAIADMTMGYLVADGGLLRPVLWLLLITIATCMYWGGMILNDVFDLEVDRRERPDRPLPAGRIAPRTAARAGGLLLVVGVTLAWTVMAVWGPSAAPWPFTAGPLGVALAVCILSYDGGFKHTVLGPLLMGACRSLNVLLGMSVTQDPGLFATAAPWMIAGAIGLYVMGITWFARREAVESPRNVLIAGLLLMVIGVSLLTLLPARGGLPVQRLRVALADDWIWPLLIWLLTAPVWRRALVALVTPQPSQVQATIRQALLALIVLDAAVALLVAGPVYAVALLALLIPASLLARLIYVT